MKKIINKIIIKYFLFITISLFTNISMQSQPISSGSWVLPIGYYLDESDSQIIMQHCKLNFGKDGIESEIIKDVVCMEINEDNVIAFSGGVFDTKANLKSYFIGPYFYSDDEIQDSLFGPGDYGQDFQIIQVPETFNEYYVIFSYFSTKNNDVMLSYYKKYSRVLGQWVISERFAYGPNLLGHGFANSKIDINTNTRKSYALCRFSIPGFSYHGLWEFNIDKYGIDNVYNGGNLLYKFPANSDDDYSKNLELKDNSSNNPIIAWTQDNKIIIYHNGMDLMHITTLNNIAGIEFTKRKGEDFIYASCNEGIVKINHETGDIIETLPNSQNYQRTFLQTAPDGHIYGVNNNGLSIGRINMNTGNFEPDVHTFPVLWGESQYQQGLMSYKTNNGQRYYTLPGNELLYETIPLTPSWNWLSYPRIERDPNGNQDPTEVLEQERFFPDREYDYLNMKHLKREPGVPNGNMTNIEWNSGWTFDNLNEVHSERGYKMYVTPDQQHIELHGTVADPASPIDIYTGDENWVGYFLPETQSVFDAIPEDVLDELYLIKGKEFTCVLDYCGSKGPQVPCWICAVNGTITLRYGDMVVLKTNASQTFTWNQSGVSTLPFEIVKPEYYSYEEKSDYTPIFVIIDSTDNPTEIAAFVGDSCIGATKVYDEDTIVRIPAYEEGVTSGEEIVFEKYYDGKSTNKIVEKYYVQDLKTGYKVERKLKTHEKADYHIVNLGKVNADEIMKPIDAFESPIQFSCRPNPMEQYCMIDFHLQDATNLDLAVYNIAGVRVATIRKGEYDGGEYHIKWNTPASLTSGIYLIKLIASGREYVQKIVKK